MKPARVHLARRQVLWLALSGCTGASVSACGGSLGGNKRNWATRLRDAPAGIRLDPPAPPTVAWFQIASCKVPGTTNGGLAWDDDGSPPDPRVVLYIAGEKALETKARSDTLEASWKGPSGNLSFPIDGLLEVAVFDVDGLRDLPIARASFPAPTPPDLARGTIEVLLPRQANVVLKVEEPRAKLGLGFHWERYGTKVQVGDVLTYSPAARAGVKPGDVILKVDGAELAGMNGKEVKTAINSIGGSPVDMVVMHAEGGTSTLSIAEGPVFPLYAERRLLD